MRRNSETMSTCRIERKRAHDREAQRASRAKTKAYIAHLEKVVADLSDSTGDNRANYLAQHAAKQSQEIDSLQGLVNKIRTLVQDHAKSDQGSSPQDDDPKLKHEGSTADSILEEGTSHTTEPFSAGLNWEDSPSEDHEPTEVVKPVEREEVRPKPRTVSATRNLIVMGISLHCADGDESTYFSRLNQAIIKVEQTPDHLSTLEEDQDILIRAILHGWDAAERVHHFDIVWRFLRAFDEGLWYRAAPLERLAHFWQMRSTMLHKIQPKNQEKRSTASFMAPTVGQQTVTKYPAVVDYFGWPQVRNHLLKQGIRNCPGKSSVAFAESFRFVWPYELRDTYKIHRSTGLYSLSEGFLKSWNDLSSFRMLQNSLIPYYVHPSLAQAMPQPTFDSKYNAEDSDESVDEEILTTTAASVGFPALDAVMQDTSVPDWITSFNMEISGDATQYFADPFSISQETSLSQWPGL